VLLNLIPHAVQMITQGTGRSITIVLESIHRCLKNLTETSMGLFHQKEPAVLMRFDLPDGTSHLAVYLSLTICPMRIMIGSNGLIALDVSLAFLEVQGPWAFWAFSMLHSFHSAKLLSLLCECHKLFLVYARTFRCSVVFRGPS
jgi:hypothetical protein